uniref:nuclear RNA export factor 2-like n=1 Tax=Urocitellus parryii TaxID=9999 RepID=UPI000E55FFCA|nr:nuclear RNA export factor 2-like [Urocitellus parryii]
MGMRDVHDESQVRYTPYSAHRDHRRGKWHDEEPTHVTLWREERTRGREMGKEIRDGVKRRWFKVTIPYGRKYDKAWLMNSIQGHCSVPFTPVDFHYIRNRARFFVQDAGTASALKDVSYKICDDNDVKILVLVSPSAVPYSVQNKFSAEQVEQLKLTMRKRYDVSQQALDLQKLRFDPDLVGHDIHMILNRRNCMFATLQIIERNFPELLSLNLQNNKLYRLDGLSDIVEKAPHVKILNLSKNELRTSKELEKLKGMELEELWLEGNPLCSDFPEQSAYVSSILELFPKLLCLDGQESPRPTLCGIEAHKKLPTCKGSFFGSDILKNLVLQFLQQYYLIYDYGDRKSLLGTYHIEACFSLTIPFNPKDPALNSFCEYFKYNRDIKKLKDSYQWKQLKHTKHDILDTLCVLPKTRHDLSSFVVDMWFHTETMLCFSVNGLFKEVEGKSQGSVRAFIRTFIAIPGSNSSLCIINDKLFVRDPSPQGNQSPFCIPMATCSSTSVPALSEEQQEMVQAFSVRSGMNLRWSQKYLEENHWDYIRATQVLTMPKVKGMVPEETLKKIDPES